MIARENQGIRADNSEVPVRPMNTPKNLLGLDSSDCSRSLYPIPVNYSYTTAESSREFFSPDTLEIFLSALMVRNYCAIVDQL